MKGVEESGHGDDQLELRGQTFGVNKAAEISATDQDLSSLGFSHSQSIELEDMPFDRRAKSKPKINVNVHEKVVPEKTQHSGYKTPKIKSNQIFQSHSVVNDIYDANNKLSGDKPRFSVDDAHQTNNKENMTN